VPSRRWIPPARLPSVPVARRLHEGDEVGGFRVVDAPGHSPGHVALWREAERLLVCGDAFFNLRSLRLEPGLREPPALLTLDPERNRRSMRRLAALEPRLAVFGHGPPVRDAAAALGALVARL
jgi:hydroxyacylglutathione hydrolase